MGWKTGLTSVTFRNLPPEEIIRLAQKAKLSGIEWGGDVHVPPGDFITARYIGAATVKAGLLVLSYGSYFRLTADCAPERDFWPVLETAQALGAPLVRFWCGEKSLAETPLAEWAKIAEKGQILAAMAQKAGILCAMEYHRNTLTETLSGAQAVLSAIRSPSLQTYWQPNPDISLTERLEEIQTLRGQIAAIHVFSWEKGNHRLPLSAKLADWQAYLQAVTPKKPPLILEFTAKDDPQQFLHDAETLHGILK